MFIFAIEKQMRNTTRKIRANCPSHTKAIYARRNELLAVELSDLFNGNQDVLAFLDNCSSVMTIKNNAGIQAFMNRRNSQLIFHAQREWIERNNTAVVRAAWSLHQKIVPWRQTQIDRVLATVQEWAFQRDPCEVNTDSIRDDSVLSRVGPERRPSYVEILDRFGGASETSSEDPTERTTSVGTELTHQTTVFRGESYKLVIRR